MSVIVFSSSDVTTELNMGTSDATSSQVLLVANDMIPCLNLQ